MKKSIIIYADCIAILEELTFEQAGRLFKAILSYVNEEPVTELECDPALKMAFVVIKKQIDRDAEKYTAKCEKNREIALAREQKKREARQNTNVHERVRTNTNSTDNDTDNDNDVSNETKLPSSLRSEGLSHGQADATQPKSFREKVLRYFNEKMACKSIKPIKAITDGTKRSDYLKARVREHGRDAVFQMIDKAACSDFLNGYNKKGFTATFDWLVLPNNFIKVLEGNYDNEQNGTENRRNNGAEQRAANAAEIIARLAAEDDAAGK